MRPVLAEVPLQKLKAEDLERLHRWLLDDDDLSPTTIRFTAGVVKMALRVAVERDYLHRNVAQQAARSPPPRVQLEIEPYTPEEARAFLAAARNDRTYAAWRLYFVFGPRRSEVLQLRWRDLDLDGPTIVIRRGGESGSTKTGKIRTWSLDAETVAILRAHHKAQGEERMALGLGKASGKDHVFTREDGRPVSPKLIRQAQIRIEKAAGVPHRRIHDMRHSAGTLALAAGVDVKRVQAMLGHASAAFTLDRYAHVLPGMAADAAEKVAHVLDDCR